MAALYPSLFISDGCLYDWPTVASSSTVHMRQWNATKHLTFWSVLKEQQPIPKGVGANYNGAHKERKFCAKHAQNKIIIQIITKIFLNRTFKEKYKKYK